MKNKYQIEGSVVKIFLHRRYGKPDLETIIDLVDFDLVNSYSGCFYAGFNRQKDSEFDGNYYAKINVKIISEDNEIKRRTPHLNRIILGLEDWNYEVDHINKDTLDNRRSNLRITLGKDNLKNRSGKNKNNKSGYRNVSWNKSINKWVIQLQIDGKNHVFDEKFDDVHESGRFAKEMRIKYYGEFAGED
jgi:hypothetical protein